MALIPDPNRVVVFIDGQNTYKRLIECFPAMPHPANSTSAHWPTGLSGSRQAAYSTESGTTQAFRTRAAILVAMRANRGISPSSPLTV
jgi:hypothetical protein